MCEFSVPKQPKMHVNMVLICQEIIRNILKEKPATLTLLPIKVHN